jgi:hypothetical protein
LKNQFAAITCGTLLCALACPGIVIKRSQPTVSGEVSESAKSLHAENSDKEVTVISLLGLTERLKSNMLFQAKVL